MATMSRESLKLLPGSKVNHPELGEGVITAVERKDFVTVFFRAYGERQVATESLVTSIDQYDQIVQAMMPAIPERIEKMWLALEAEQIPLMDSAATLTAAKIDLLPHKVVLVLLVANARPIRF